MSAPRHIAIVGGGIIGAACLSALAESSHRNGAIITLFEGSKEIAPGASSKSGGFLAADWHGPQTESLGALSFQLHEKLAATHEGASRWGYRPLDTYSATLDNTEQRKPRKDSNKLKWIDGTALVKNLAEMGSPETTAQVTPGLLSRFLVERASSLPDVNVRLSSPVAEIKTSAKGKVEAVVVKAPGTEAGQEVVNVTDVIICAGPWTGSLLDNSLKPDSSLRDLPFVQAAMGIQGSRAHSIIIKDLPDTGAHALFTSLTYRGESDTEKAGSPEFYCRPDGTVYVCGDTDAEELPSGADLVTVSDRQIQRVIEQAEAVSPAISTSGAKITHRQACYLPISTNTGMPIIRFDSNSGFGIAAGHSCWGITLSLGTGQVMSELILQGEAKSANISHLGGL